ncbi:MAG: hypothetical protein ACKVPY_15095 [Paracoccaceae bacterium]
MPISISWTCGCSSFSNPWGECQPTNPSIPRPAPSTVTPSGGAAQTLTYDGNGNQTAGLDGKVMAYDGENRPVSVVFGTEKTRLTSTAPTGRG